MAFASMRFMPARFTSVCGGCDKPINVGDIIRYVKGFKANHDGCGDPTVSTGRARRGYTVSDNRGGWVHVNGGCGHEDFPCCGCA